MTAGRIVKDVNTTCDVGVNEITKQAKKFGNEVDKDGYPLMINNTSNILYNMGLTESYLMDEEIEFMLDEAVYSGNIGAMEVMRFFMQVKKSNITLEDYVKQLSQSDNPDDIKLGWAIIQQFLGVQLKGKEFGEKTDESYVKENSSSGSTSASSIASVTSQSKNKKRKKTHNSDGTIKNAVEEPFDLFYGTPIKRK